MIGSRIKEARLAAGLSQRVLADMVNVTATTISEWERSKIPIGYMQSLRLSGVLGAYGLSMTALGYAAISDIVEVE